MNRTFVVHFTDGTRETFLNIDKTRPSSCLPIIYLIKKNGDEIALSIRNIKYIEELGG